MINKNQKREKQRITQIARIRAKKASIFYKQKMTIINLFVKFVLLVVKKIFRIGGWGISLNPW
jgi:hypothetical protein